MIYLNVISFEFHINNKRNHKQTAIFKWLDFIIQGKIVSEEIK